MLSPSSFSATHWYDPAVVLVAEAMVLWSLVARDGTSSAWLWPSRRWWAGGEQHTEGGVLLLYRAYSARYAGLLVLLPFEHARSDLAATAVHHVARPREWGSVVEDLHAKVSAAERNDMPGRRRSARRRRVEHRTKELRRHRQ